jgi:hypothetical protein
VKTKLQLIIIIIIIIIIQTWCIQWVRTLWDPILFTNHVANYILMTINALCLTEQITLSYCITQRDGSYQYFS